MENIVHNSVSILAGLVVLVSSSVSALPAKVHDFTSKFSYQPSKTAYVTPSQAPVEPTRYVTPTAHVNQARKPEQVTYLGESFLTNVVNVFQTAGSSISQGLNAIAKFIGFGKKPASTLAQKTESGRNPAVLAATIDRTITGVTFTIPAFFKELVKLDKTLEVSGDTTLQNLEVNGPSTFNGDVTLTNQDLDLGTGSITAANVLYGVTAGSGIKVGTGQNPEISLNVDYVKSIDGLTGDVSLSAGSGISVSGATITNSDKGSAQNIFKTFSVSGQDDVVADSNTDALTFIAGTGIVLTNSATDDSITITSNLDPGWTDDGTTVRLSTITDSVGIGTTNPTSKLHLVGGDFRIGTGTFDNASSGDDLYVTGNFEVDGTIYGNISSGSIDPGLGIGAIAFQGASGLAGTPSQLYWDNASYRLGIGSSSPSAKLYVAGTGIFTGAITSAGLDAGNGGITNAGAITGATGLTSSGTITFASLGAGVAQLSSGGVLSSSALNLAGSNITGTLGIGNGGTGLTTFTTGDLLYGSATDTIGRIGIGGSGQVLTVAGGVPTWASITGGGGGGGGLCPNCLITDPGSSQTIAPSGSGTTGLAIRQTSGGGSSDIFKVTSSDGATAYLRVDSTGSVVLGNGGVSSGTFTVNPSGYDPISISPVAQGAGAFTGTLTSNDLTAARTWTLPDATGAICLDTGNCAGSGGNLGGSGTANYLARWNAQYVLENGSLFDNGNVGIGTTNPLAKLEVASTAWLRGSSTTSGLYVASNGNVGIGTTSAAYNLDVAGTANVSGAVTLGSTLNVTGATTILSSTMSITGTTTIGGNLQVNGAGNSWVMGNFGIGTSSPTSNLTFGSASTVGLATSTTALNIQSGLMNFDTSNSRVGIGTTAPQATFDVTNNAISTGTGLLVSSTSTSFSSGMLASVDWSPSSSTVATGDLLSVNVGANGIVGNIFNVKDGGTSVFSVSQTAITAGLPVNFTAPGDVNIAYDLMFSNQTASTIKSLGPLAIEAGESFESNYLTLRTFNAGQLVLDLSGGLTMNQAQNWTLATATNALTFGNILGIDTTNSRLGIGTTLPKNKLDVNGSVAFGSLPTSPLPQSNSAYFSGNVGIGTTSPAYTLDVTGIIRASATVRTAELRDTIDYFELSASGLKMGGGVPISWGGTLWYDAQDVGLSRGAAGKLYVGNGTAGNSSGTLVAAIIGVGTTSPSANLDVGSTATTGTGIQLTSNSLTTGKGLYITSTSTALSTGNLAAIDWSPGSSTTATGDLLSVNVGANGIVGNIFNVKDNGTSVFAVSQTAITAGLPVNFTAPGDVGVAYDLNLTNQTASYIKSNAPLTIEVGESWESNDLTLRTFNAGQLVLDTPSGLTLNQAQNWTFATSAQALNISNGLMNFDTTNARVGIGTSNPIAGFEVQKTAWLRGGANAGNAGFYVDGSGRVGIGTTNPSAALTFGNATNVSLASAVAALNFQNGLLSLDTTNSRVGIGTSNPQNKLDVSGSVAFGSLPTTALPQSNSAYFSGRVGIGTTNPSTSLQIVGGDCSDDAGGAGCTADYAELYPASENVEKGDVLMIDTSASSAQATVKRANKAYAHNLIGIVSTNPAAIAEGSKMTFMNTEYKLDPRKPAVALAGRVPVKIDPESQSLVAGDMLTSSNKPGMAMKATHAGAIIGKALEAWTQGSGKDKVLVFVNNTWADPELALNETGEVAGATSTMASVSPEQVDAVAKDMAKVSGQLDTLATNISTLDSKVSGVTSDVEKLVADNNELKDRVNTLDDMIKKLQDGAGSILGVGVGSSNPDLASGEQTLADASDELTIADSLIDGQKGEFSELRVSGLAKLNDINVIGNASIGFLDITGMDLNGGSNIDTITGPLRLQSTAQNSLEIMNGKVIVSKEGNITTTGEITAKKLNILDESTDETGATTKADSSIGTGTLLKGKKSVVISTTALTRASKVFITPKTLLDYPLVVTGIKAGESFTVEVKSAEDTDVEFDWFIVN